MHPLKLTGLQYLMDISKGNPDIVIGVIDGPIDITHPAFHGSKIELYRLKDCRL